MDLAALIRQDNERERAAVRSFVETAIAEDVEGFVESAVEVATLLGEHLEDDTAEVSAEGADGLVVSLALGAFFSRSSAAIAGPVCDGDRRRPSSPSWRGR